MKPIKTQKNLYPGINPLLNSQLLAEAMWGSFHTTHIGVLSIVLRSQLIPIGYTADAEQSLQIRAPELILMRPRADVLIRGAESGTESSGLSSHAITIPLPEVVELSDTKPYHAIAIYPLNRETGERGEAVAWIELLSPTNKPGGRHYEAYHNKREDILDSGLVYLELDYIHESLPTVSKIPLYPQDMNAKAYRILVFDPRPSFNEGTLTYYPFGPDEAISDVKIPLLGNDFINFDFNVPYQKTYSEMLYGIERVDYSQLPPNFETYSESDRAYILSHCLALMATDDIETLRDFERLPLEEALKQYQSLLGEI